MDPNLSQKIIEANLELHQKEAKYYDLIHPEIFCPREQRLIGQVLEQALNLLNQDKIQALDVGAGTGNIALKLVKERKISSITALDLSQEMLRELLQKLQGNTKVKIVNSDIDSFLAEDKQLYDLVTISSVLHHLPDYFITIEKLQKKLNPQGIILIFHEPTGEKSKILGILTWLDSRLFVNLCLPKQIKEVVKTLDHSYSDYHVYHNFDLSGLRKYFASQPDLKIFYFQRQNVFALGIFRLAARLLSAKNNFILGIQKIK
jgi:ubiquinone/menaquinone biosynthesis C-methylase UbiE